MKHTENLKIAAAALGAFLLPLLPGCNNAEYKVIDDAIYLSEAYAASSKKITADTVDSTLLTATVRATSPVSRDTKATLGVDQQALEDFNKKNGTNYVMLPDSLYAIGSADATIPAGQVVAPAVPVTVKPFSQNLIDTGNKYALPLTIKQAEGHLLGSMKSMIYILEPLIVTSVPVFTGGYPAKLNMRKEYHLSQWSLEFRVNISKLGTEIGQLNNQALFYAGKTEIYIRFGDAPIKGNILQIKTNGTQINCPTEFRPNKWYHLAFVYNGSQMTVYVDGNVEAALDTSGQYDLKPPFTLCNNSNEFLKANVMMSEVRFWTTAIPQKQIQNNMYAINPQTPGLEGYWKLNEGKGATFHDATGHGNEGIAPNGVVKWVSGIRSDGKESK